jgi:hypothetical protein
MENHSSSEDGTATSDMVEDSDQVHSSEVGTVDQSNDVSDDGMAEEEGTSFAPQLSESESESEVDSEKESMEEEAVPTTAAVSSPVIASTLVGPTHSKAAATSTPAAASNSSSTQQQNDQQQEAEEDAEDIGDAPSCVCVLSQLRANSVYQHGRYSQPLLRLVLVVVVFLFFFCRVHGDVFLSHACVVL